MFIQEKRYLTLWKSDKKVAKAGLLKLSIWDNRVKVDYFLNVLPIYYECDAKCVLQYKMVGETTSNKTEWNFSLSKNQVQYDFQIQTSGQIQNVDFCYIVLAGNYIIAGEKEAIIDLMQLKAPDDNEITANSGDIEKSKTIENSGSIQKNRTIENNESIQKTVYNKDIGENREAVQNGNAVQNGEAVQNRVTDNKNTLRDNDVTADIASNSMNNTNSYGGDMVTEDQEKGEVESSELNGKIIHMNPSKVRKVDYIQDLQYLLKKEGKVSELYYNSFLLHGFYQYRHFVICPEFIGIPGNFYEREAVAAKMMGFPYFIEAEFLESCQFGGSTRESLPQTGTFGYYLQIFKPAVNESQDSQNEESQNTQTYENRKES